MTERAAVTPPAAGWFSTMTGTRKRSDSRSARNRSAISDADPAANNLTLGPNADVPPAGMSRQQYVTEARWNVNTMTCNGKALEKGHTYRMQFMVHDGDQNKTGGDVGQACATVIIPQ